jgi:hypothetical protein
MMIFYMATISRISLVFYSAIGASWAEITIIGSMGPPRNFQGGAEVLTSERVRPQTKGPIRSQKLDDDPKR